MAVKRQVVFGVASLAALYVGVASAQGLGELRLDSALNQPLSAVISIQGGENISPSDLLVTLASPEAFEKAGIERPHFLTDLRFIPVIEDRRLIIRVESNRPVREPYLNFLVELRRPNGRMLREYTVLLDPPLFNSSAASSTAFSVPAAPAQEPRRPRPAPPEPVSRTNAAPVPSSAPRSQAPLTAASLDLPDIKPAPGARIHTTVAGDTLWDIAARNRPDRSVGIRDSMAAIKSLNPGAFVDGDLNRLRVGQELVLPTNEQLRGSDARGVVAADPAPRTEAAVAARAPVAEPEDAPAPATDSVVDTTPGAADSDLAQAPAEERVAAAPEEAITSGQLRIEESRVSAAEADAEELLGRLQSLEARFNVLLNELDARDRQIASLQAELEVLRQARDAEESADMVAGVPGGVLGGGDAGPGPSSPDGSDTPGSIQAEGLPAQDAQPQGFMTGWWPAFAAAGAFLLGLLVAGARSRSNRENEEAEPVSEQPEPSPARPGPALLGSSMLARPAAPQSPRPVDPLDGVELYVTYGRFAEARAMLDKAITEDPARLDLRYKQLRVLGELGDVPAFEEQEEEIRALGGDEERIEQIRERFPSLFDDGSASGLVEHVDHVEPLLDEEDVEDSYEDPQSLQADEQARQVAAGSQLNLNDFTLDPDWDLIEGLTPSPRKNKDAEVEDTPDISGVFESSLHEFPEVEELDDEHHEHFGSRSKDDPKK